MIILATKVAKAAPDTPILNIYMNIGSNIIFETIPMALIINAILLLP